jgi:hypothetical protein
MPLDSRDGQNGDVSGSQPSPATIEADLRDLMRAVTETEQASGMSRRCSYGLRPDGTYSVLLPDGYSEAIDDLKSRYGDSVTFRVVSWALLIDWRDGPLTDARGAIREALAGRAIDPDSISSDAIQIDSGSRRVRRQTSPYFRVWVREDILRSKRVDP